MTREEKFAAADAALEALSDPYLMAQVLFLQHKKGSREDWDQYVKDALPEEVRAQALALGEAMLTCPRGYSDEAKAARQSVIDEHWAPLMDAPANWPYFSGVMHCIAPIERTERLTCFVKALRDYPPFLEFRAWRVGAIRRLVDADAS